MLIQSCRRIMRRAKILHNAKQQTINYAVKQFLFAKYVLVPDDRVGTCAVSCKLRLKVTKVPGIYSGYFTATESAAVALAYAMFVEFVIYREMTLRKLAATVVETSQLLGTLAPIIAIAMSLNILLTT